MNEQEEIWWLKSRAIWLERRDENTNFFQDFEKGRKIQNTIWGLKNENNEDIISFEGLANLGITHFKSLFKEDNMAIIDEVIRLSQFFLGLSLKKII